MNASTLWKLLVSMVVLFLMSWGCSPTTQVCKSNGDCLSGQRCDSDKGSCVTATSCKTDGNCKANEACTDGVCQGVRCNPVCKSNESCKHGKCEKKEGACDRNEECPTGEGCKKGMCAKVECRGNMDCAVGKVCKDFQCVAGGAIPKIGERCDRSKGDKACEEGAVCWGLLDKNKDKPVCYKGCLEEFTRQTKVCGENQTCIQTYRKVEGKTVWAYVCADVAKEGEPCDTTKGTVCKDQQWPPLFCSSKGLCQKAKVVDKGADCHPSTYKENDPKICDRNKGLACNRTTKKCQEATVGKELDVCDQEKSICGPGLVCVRYYLNGKTIGAHCMKTCKVLSKEKTCGDGKICTRGTHYYPFKASYLRYMNQGNCFPSGERKIGEVCEHWRPGMPALDPSRLCNILLSRTGAPMQCTPGWPGTKKGICMLRFPEKEECEKGCKEGICALAGGTAYLCAAACSDFVGCSDKNAACYEMDNGQTLCGPKAD